MKSEPITIKDIAKALNLSVSTISKALRGSYEISKDTQLLVKQYAEQHHYKPNPIAQGLRKGKSKSIAVIVPHIDNNFFSQVINGIESIAHGKEYNVIITQTHESWEREVLTTRHHFSRSVDGIIISMSSESQNTEHFQEVQENGLPLVFFDRIPENLHTHKVIANNFQGSYDATIHLLDQGFDKIAHITSAGFLSITVERLAGYIKALEERNIPIQENYIRYCAHGGMIMEELEKAVNELLALEQKPQAILTASDRLSTQALSYLTEKGMRVPEDIALAGFTNSATAHLFNPAFTAIVQPAFEMGKAAMELLIQMIESRKPVNHFEKVVLNTELQVRKSSLNLPV